MEKACLHAAAALAALAGASAGQACRANLSPGQRLAMGYERGAISAVALVRITAAAHTRPRSGDAHPWRASATVERVYRGALAGKAVSFERGWGSAACDDGRPPPEPGEAWVVYFWRRGPGDQPVWQTYPARVAFAADPYLARGLR